MDKIKALNYKQYLRDIQKDRPKFKCRSSGTICRGTSKMWFDFIVPVFEYLIGNGYINPSWTTESFHEFVKSNSTDSIVDYIMTLKDIQIGDTLWNTIYLHYHGWDNLIEMSFRFERAETDTLPVVPFKGWIYYKDEHVGRQKLDGYDIYIEYSGF